MWRKLKEILQKKFIKNVLLVASGTALAQIITFVLLPIITRLYGPEAYGIMGSFVATINIFVPIAALTLPIAIVLPKEDSEAQSIIKTSMKLIIVISAVLFIVILALQGKIIDLFNIEEIANYLLLIPVAVFLAGLSQIMQQWLIRNNTFNVIASATVYQALFSHGGMVLVGFAYPLASILIVFTVIKHGLLALLIYLNIRKKNTDLKIQLNHTPLTTKKVFEKYYDFPKYRAPETFLNAVSQGMPVLFMTSFFGVAAAGFYTLCRSVLQVPVKLLGKSVGEVFYPRISKASHSNESLTPLITKATILLAVTGLIPFGVIIAFGPFLFSLIFGADWSTAGEYAQWIAIWTYFGFMNKPSVHSFPVLNAQKLHLIMSIFMLIIRLSILLFGFLVLDDDILTVAMLGISGVILNSILIYLAIRLSKKYDRGLLNLGRG